MIDLVFGVPDPLRWHEENFARHPDHYAGLGRFGPTTVAFLQVRPAEPTVANETRSLPRLPRARLGVSTRRDPLFAQEHFGAGMWYNALVRAWASVA